MTTTYQERGSSYAAQSGVTVKTETYDYRPGRPTKIYAMGQDIPDYFECVFDSFGNICDTDGIIVYPSRSGAHPLERGEHGYFGEFRENYGQDVHPELPSVKSMSIRSARTSAGLTQKQLAEMAGVNVNQIQKIERGEIIPGNMTAKNLLAIADALGVDPRDLI